jgi:hypothetical protein
MIISRSIPDNLASCPHCLTPQSGSHWITCDGDTIPISDEGRGGRLWECRLFNFKRGGNLERVRACAAGRFQWDITAYGGALDCCGKEFFYVDMRVAGAEIFEGLDAEAADDWINKYFWENEPITDPVTTYTVKGKPRTRSLLPQDWLVEQIDLPTGWVHWHKIGPLKSTNPVLVEGEMRMCSGSAFWNVARKLALDAWPRVVKLARLNFAIHAID